mmetsp:Transcript_17095/g.20333  ORF Transcript_17095/g.20333 Transcript_17095/m.20333 type:complete len:84 (-) Transcript_17095:350-601(-)
MAKLCGTHVRCVGARTEEEFAQGGVLKTADAGEACGGWGVVYVIRVVVVMMVLWVMMMIVWCFGLKEGKATATIRDNDLITRI